MKRLLFISSLVLLCLHVDAQHGALVSQYMLNGLPLNPAFTGSRDAASVAASYRNQWVSLEGAPVTKTLSMHAPLKNDDFAVGLLAYNDKIGVSNITGIQFSGAYRIRFPEGRLSFGLSGGLQHASNKWGDVITTEEQDVVFSSGNDQYLLPDFGMGVYYYTQKAYVSFSVPSLIGAKYAGGNEYAISGSVQNMDFYLNGGYRFEINRDFDLIPSAMIKYKKASPVQLDLNLRAAYRDLIECGFSYRTGDAIVSMLRGHVNDQFSIGYAFDFTITALGRYNNGTHEVTLQYDFKYKTDASNPRFF